MPPQVGVRSFLISLLVASNPPRRAARVTTETQLLTNLKAMGITLVCVAHRLISAQMSDHLVVLKDGQLLESGAPAVLSAASDSFYAQRSRLIPPSRGRTTHEQ